MKTTKGSASKYLIKKRVNHRQNLPSAIPNVLSLLLLISSSLFLPTCKGGGGQEGIALFSQLLNRRMTVVLKGSYASDRPLGLAEINNNQIFVDATDTAPDLSGLPAYDQLALYLDIGEIRMSTKDFLVPLEAIQTQSDSDKFWDPVSTSRQVYCNRLYSTKTTSDSCLETGGLINFVEFMNGRGAIFPSSDVGPGTYLHTGIFMRGIVTGYSRIDGLVGEVRFDSFNLFDASNILPLSNYDAGLDDASVQALTPQLFPLHHLVNWGQQVDMIVDNTFLPMVLEIRFNIHENLMAHAFLNTSGQRRTVVGFSDWRRPHTDEYHLGGNVLARSRIYYPDIVSHLRITGGTASNRHYYALYIANECVDSNLQVACDLDDQLPLAATPVRNGADNLLKNLRPGGTYLLQCRWDGDAAQDGYPETVLGSKSLQIDVERGGTASIDCLCGASTTTGCN